MAGLLQFTSSLTSCLPECLSQAPPDGRRFHKCRPRSADTQVGVVKRNALLVDPASLHFEVCTFEETGPSSFCGAHCCLDSRNAVQWVYTVKNLFTLFSRGKSCPLTMHSNSRNRHQDRILFPPRHNQLIPARQPSRRPPNLHGGWFQPLP